MELTGLSLIGGAPVDDGAGSFHGVDPASGAELEPAFRAARPDDVARAAELAKHAWRRYSRATPRMRAGLLSAIAVELEALAEPIVERAERETALPAARLRAELGRTCGQLRMFASLVAEGSWVDARIDHADRQRQPAPKPDVRSLLRPIGPVAVFGASNFPLAFSVAGVDTAAALAAGNPVIVKAHPAHPGTSELAGHAIARALRARRLAAGVFALLFDDGHDIGRALVEHPLVKAVGFTGSQVAGRSLMDLAASRPTPIPVFAEMGSINPVFLLPGRLAARGTSIADSLHGSLVLGVGQYCTNPGLWVGPAGGQLDELCALVRQRIEATPPGTMLSRGICDAYHAGVARLRAHPEVELVAGGEQRNQETGTRARPALLSTDVKTFVQHPSLMDEVFGPAALIVRCHHELDMVDVARSLGGQLSATVLGSETELAAVSELLAVLADRAGRLLFDGVPTGVEVCPAMVHGGPYPATSDGRSSSVGTRAIARYARPVAFQDCPNGALPPELRDDNPFDLWRLVDGRFGQH